MSTSDEEAINQLLEDFHIAETRDTTTTSSTRIANRWRPIAKRAINSILNLQTKKAALEEQITLLRSESDGWREQYDRTEAHSSRLSQQLRNAGLVPLPGRSSSRGRSLSRPGGLRRRPSDPNQRVHFAHNESSSSGTNGQLGERQSRSYHLSADQLRRDRAAPRANGEETRDEFLGRKKREFHAERDRLARRFNPHLRGPSNVQFPGFQPFPGAGMPRPPTAAPAPPAPMPVPHDIPCPYDPLRRPQDVPPRQDALPPELYPYVMSGGTRDIFGRVHSRR